VGDVIVGAQECAIYTAGLELDAALPGAEPIVETQPADFPARLVPVERLSCASTRADAIMALVFKVGRAEAQTAIEFGFAFLDFNPLTNRSARLKAGDQLVYRSKGRVEIVALEENARSGRMWVEFRRFPC
jgi:RNA-binding protein YlmH